MWKRMILVLAVLLFALPAGAQTLTYGLSPTGTRIPVAVDAAGKVIISAAAALGLVQVAGVNGTGVATAANPFPVRLNADGTNPMDATHPIAVSATLGANLVTNPFWLRISQDGTTAVGAANPLPVSATMGANAAGNPIHVQIGDGTTARKPPWAKLDDDDIATNYIAINVAGGNYNLPGAGEWYCVSAQANSACIVCGAAPAANMTTQCTLYVPESGTKCRILTGPVCRVIGPSTAGYVRFERLNPAL